MSYRSYLIFVSWKAGCEKPDFVQALTSANNGSCEQYLAALICRTSAFPKELASPMRGSGAAT